VAERVWPAKATKSRGPGKGPVGEKPEKPSGKKRRPERKKNGVKNWYWKQGGNGPGKAKLRRNKPVVKGKGGVSAFPLVPVTTENAGRKTETKARVLRGPKTNGRRVKREKADMAKEERAQKQKNIAQQRSLKTKKGMPIATKTTKQPARKTSEDRAAHKNRTTGGPWKA